MKILPLTADEIFGLRYEDGKMPSSNNFRVFIILKGANYFGNELDNAQSEYGATLSPAPYFFLIRWEPLFGSGAQANKFSLVLSFAKRNMTVKFKTREILFKKMINFLLVLLFIIITFSWSFQNRSFRHTVEPLLCSHHCGRNFYATECPTFEYLKQNMQS